MNIVEEAVKSINTMYEGGSAPLSEYKFQSHELTQKQAQMLFTNDRVISKRRSIQNESDG
ncbi:MAG: hypothetical protein ACLTXH_01165 [Enterobacter hormaechei]